MRSVESAFHATVSGGDLRDTPMFSDDIGGGGGGGGGLGAGAVASASVASSEARFKRYLEETIRDLERQIEHFQSDRKCKICYEREWALAFSPCGHLCACADCAARCTTCPICRADIDNLQKIVVA
jgi:E3 ubiquitin-protein ligase MYLIP